MSSTRPAPDPSQPFSVAAAAGEFHRMFGLPGREGPGDGADEALARLRIALMEEEVAEFVAASGQDDLIGIADALADIVYVAYWAAVTYGIDLDAVLREVHRSNMTKLDANGNPVRREDGKVLKSELYSPPDIASALGLDR